MVTAGTVTDYGVTAQTAPMAQGARIVWHRDRFIASEFDGKSGLRRPARPAPGPCATTTRHPANSGWLQTAKSAC